jgi:acyl-CoA synthetase (NDP forming)
MMLSELEAKALLASYDVPVNKGYAAASVDEALDRAREIGYPVVVKALSEKITHKSDLGLVQVDICSDKRLREAFERIVKKARSIDPKANAVVESMAAGGMETIVGAKRDPQFGPTVLFGLGGIFVEVFKDVSVRVAPVDREMALEMIGEIKGSVILKGYRGKKPVDIEALADIIVRVSGLMMARSDVLELDANPVIAYEHGAVAVDARVLLKENKEKRL